MIISASYKTDIPTFYGRWFINRLRAGYCKTLNPYSGHASRVELTRESVDGFVFWTKNIGPFLRCLEEVAERGFPFVVQYTITGYPRALESFVVEPSRSIEHMMRLHELYGPDVAVWRYDTIVVSSLTPVSFHRRNFETLAKSLEGVTNEVVISFAQLYKKTQRNLDLAARRYGFTWEDPSDSVKRGLPSELAAVARAYGMKLTICAQRQFLQPGIEDARCVDAQRLARVAGKPIRSRPGTSRQCGCDAARDIGEYDTCPHGCAYCYAVGSRQVALERYRKHDPDSEFLFLPEANPLDEDTSDEDSVIQQRLF